MVMVKNINYLSLMILIGIAVGFLWLVNPGGVFLFALVVFFGVMLWRFSNEKDRKFIMAIFIFGIISRIIIYFILGYISIFAGRNGWLSGDSLGIYNFAWIWAQQVDGVPNIIYLQGIDGHLFTVPSFPIIGVLGYGYSGFTYLLGTVHYFFGPLKFSPRLLNCLMGVGAGIFIYYIVKDIFGRETAKLSAILTVFTPSLFLWSITFMKDIPFIFIGCIILWSLLRFQKTKKALYLFILFVAIYIQYTIRYKFSTALIILVIFFFFTIPGISWRKKIIIFICLLILIVPLLHRIDFKSIASNRMAKSLEYTRGIVGTGGSTYKVFDDKYYIGGSMSNSNHISPIDFTKGFFKGWLYFLFMPFPWKIYSKLLLISYPQVVLWYLTIPFVIIGMATALRYRWKETFIILTYIFIYGSIIAMSSGNIGTVFRHRDILTPLFLVFAATGFMKIVGHLNNLRQ